MITHYQIRQIAKKACQKISLSKSLLHSLLMTLNRTPKSSRVRLKKSQHKKKLRVKPSSIIMSPGTIIMMILARSPRASLCQSGVGGFNQLPTFQLFQFNREWHGKMMDISCPRARRVARILIKADYGPGITQPAQSRAGYGLQRFSSIRMLAFHIASSLVFFFHTSGPRGAGNNRLELHRVIPYFAISNSTRINSG